MFKKFMRKRIGIVAPFLVLIAFVGLVWAGTVSEKPYGIATPKWYRYSAGVK